MNILCEVLRRVHFVHGDDVRDEGLDRVAKVHAFHFEGPRIVSFGHFVQTEVEFRPIFQLIVQQLSALVYLVLHVGPQAAMALGGGDSRECS